VPNIRQLEYLVAIADTLNFRRAAERTNTTQPTLSEQLKVLEERLGAQLVERGRSRVMLTPIGVQVVEIGRRILRDAEEIRNLTASGGKELSGLLRLGLPPTIGPYLLPRIVPTLHTNYPGLKLYVREEVPQRLPRALEDGGLDVIITMLPVVEADFVSVPLFREPLHLVVAADHPLARHGSVERRDLEGQYVLALGPDHQLHEVAAGLCSEFGARLRHDFEGTSLDTLREMVVMGLGVTFLPGLYVRREILTDPSCVVLELRGRSIFRTVGMVWRKASARQSSYERLAAFFRVAITQEFGDMQPIQ
jgi:LysR family transcriptional regulator, hydrogen peroxide-inducible genes activator